MGQGVVVDVGIEVHSVVKTFGIGGEPTAKGGEIIAPAKIDEASLGVGPLGGKTPGILGVARQGLFSEGGVAIKRGCIGDEGGDVALEVVDGNEDMAA